MNDGTFPHRGLAAFGALASLPTTLAPTGGLLPMLGRLMIAGDALRR